MHQTGLHDSGMGEEPNERLEPWGIMGDMFFTGVTPTAHPRPFALHISLGRPGSIWSMQVESIAQPSL